MKDKDGYKTTAIGMIPTDWGIDEFSGLFEVESRNGLTRPTAIRGQGFPMINMKELFAFEKIDESAQMELVPLNKSEAENYSVKKGDLLFARQSIVTSGAGKCSIISSMNKICTFESHIIRVRLKSTTQPAYYFYYINSPYGRISMDRIVTQVAAAGIRGSDLKKILVPIPPLPEQQKIADILSTVDEHISDTESLIEKTKTLKQGMMQRLLTKGIGQTEFKETEIGRIPLEWKIVPITDTAAFINGHPFKPEEWSQAGIPIIRIQNLTDTSKEYNFSEVRLDQSYTVSCGELLLSWSGTIGIYTWRGIDAYLNQHIYKVLPNALSVKDFLKHSLNFVVKKMSEKSHGSTMKHITKREMSTISVPLPPLSEQREIASILTTIDDQIDVYQSKLEALIRLKSGLMQQLLTGSIRVKI